MYMYIHKELAYVIVQVGKSKICKASCRLVTQGIADIASLVQRQSIRKQNFSSSGDFGLFSQDLQLIG